MSKVNDNYEINEEPMTQEELNTELAFNEDEILKALTDNTQHEDRLV